MTARITITPNPAQKGQDITICYDFSGLSETQVTLTLNWDPSQEPGSITLSPEDNCQTVTAGDSANDLLVADNSGNSEDEAVTFS